jgi:hypothetical protein
MPVIECRNVGGMRSVGWSSIRRMRNLLNYYKLRR